MGKKRAARQPQNVDPVLCRRCGEEITSKPTQVTRQKYSGKLIIRKWFVCQACGQSQVVRSEQ